jgi:hypothetical protein
VKESSESDRRRTGVVEHKKNRYASTVNYWRRARPAIGLAA